MCDYRLICVAILLLLDRFPRHSQYPPGAISPPARHLSQIELGHEILRGARGHFELAGNWACRQDWPRDHEIRKGGQVRVRTPADQSSVELTPGEQPSVMLFHPPLRRLRESVEKRHEPGRRVSRTPAIACDRAKTRVKANEMRRGSRTTPEDCADQESAQPGFVLQRVDLLPGEEGDRGGEQRRHILRAPNGLAPRQHARIFVPVEIIDHRIATFRRTRGQLGQKALRASADRLDPGKVAGERTIVRVFVWREPLLIERIDLFLLGAL
jgi:hypothetical protein